ncbi:hypothetical protein P691DRAFT_760525 [Macrolepiota fuliginosa MF-IS2]|uniref:Uncharacterized protein n=1 Tax=Macrolepiota fuliginosa MF-IS2 TaxID=1400762 RepID=A0A9P5XCS4_9AGAR|nr:hypothetical protein P691DRAFT_760525 [Macrolepiota fuliginosa MF-IS2]
MSNILQAKFTTLNDHPGMTCQCKICANWIPAGKEAHPIESPDPTQLIILICDDCEIHYARKLGSLRKKTEKNLLQCLRTAVEEQSQPSPVRHSDLLPSHNHHNVVPPSMHDTWVAPLKSSLCQAHQTSMDMSDGKQRSFDPVLIQKSVNAAQRTGYAGPGGRVTAMSSSSLQQSCPAIPEASQFCQAYSNIDEKKPPVGYTDNHHHYESKRDHWFHESIGA